MDTDEALKALLLCTNWINQLLTWYVMNVVYYPATVLITAIILQMICSYQSKIRYYACYTIVYLYPAVMSLFLFPYFITSRSGMLNCLHGSYVLRYMNRIIGVEWELVNGHFLEREKGSAIITANHQSMLDILGLFEIWHTFGRCTAVARRLLFWVWPFGLMAWRAGVIFIDRKSFNPKTQKKINDAGAIICQQKAKLIMFPEGTRNKIPDKLLPFKKGAFRLAIESQIPIIPIVFSPYYFVDKEKKHFYRGKAVINVLEPIQTKGLTLNDLDDLIENVYNVMSLKNTELRKRFLSNEHTNGTVKEIK